MIFRISRISRKHGNPVVDRLKLTVFKISNFVGLESIKVFDVNGLARAVFLGIAARVARLAFNEMNEIGNRDVNFE